MSKPVSRKDAKPQTQHLIPIEVIERRIYLMGPEADVGRGSA
jgi:hypothetical protein